MLIEFSLPSYIQDKGTLILLRGNLCILGRDRSGKKDSIFLIYKPVVLNYLNKSSWLRSKLR